MAEIPTVATGSLIEWAGDTRATLTIVFTDIVGSTALGSRLGDTRMSPVRVEHFARSAMLLNQYAGREIKTIGDGIMAVFRSAGAALDYAYALHLDPGHDELQAQGVRAGIHTGSVEVTSNDIFGSEVAFAAHVARQINGAEIWVSSQSFTDLRAARAAHHENLRWRDHPGITMKGFEDTHTLWSLARPGAGRSLAEIAADKSHSGALVPPPRSDTISNIPPGLVPRHFMGREDALVAIDAALQRYQGRAAIIAALHGLRGVGKTVLAAAYAEFHQSEYRAIWWLRAQTEAGLRADLVALGVRLGWVPPDETEQSGLAVVQERLRRAGEGVLLLYDNAIDADTLKPYLPSGGSARVLVTSNAAAWRGVAEPVEIGLWPKEIGADYLIARTGYEGERSAAEALSEALGGLPLAHEQAGAYCERLGIPPAVYRQRFEATPARMLDTERDAPAEYHDKWTVTRTFGLAIDEAAKLHPAAGPLIVHGALLAPERIPLFLFAEARECFPEPFASALAGDGLDEAVAALRAFALIDREPVADERDPSIITDTIRLHRLVRQVAAFRCSAEARDTACRALIEAVTARADRNRQSRPIEIAT